MMKRLVLAIALSALALGCGSTGPGAFSDVQVSFATQAASQPVLAVAHATHANSVFYDDTLVSGSDTLVLTEVELVLRKIELEPVEVEDCDTAEDVAGCEEFEAGPVLVSLPLDGSVRTEFELDIPPGAYDKIEFEIHKVGNGDEDAEFRAAHPDFVDISIRARGTFNGSSFEFTTDLDVEQELEFSPPLVVEENDGTNITILVSLDEWFVVSGRLVNPETGNKGGSNESEIKENIKQSTEAFEDEDRDGKR